MRPSKNSYLHNISKQRDVSPSTIISTQVFQPKHHPNKKTPHVFFEIKNMPPTINYLQSPSGSNLLVRGGNSNIFCWEFSPPKFWGRFNSPHFDVHIFQQTGLVEIQPPTRTRWWFQISFIFTTIWGRFLFWLIFFRWVETTQSREILRQVVSDGFSSGCFDGLTSEARQLLRLAADHFAPCGLGTLGGGRTMG